MKENADMLIKLTAKNSIGNVHFCYQYYSIKTNKWPRDTVKPEQFSKLVRSSNARSEGKTCLGDSRLATFCRRHVCIVRAETMTQNN